MQEYLWDGVKRDRLAWIGDMHPEISTIARVFGAVDVVPKSLNLIRNATEPTQWMNGIPSYTMWWVKIQRDWFYYTGDMRYLKEQKGMTAQTTANECLEEIRFDNKYIVFFINENGNLSCAVMKLSLIHI